MSLNGMYHLRTVRYGFLIFVLALSLGLGAFIFLSARSAPAPVSSSAPTEEAYRAAVKPIVTDVRAVYASAATDTERMRAVDAALNDLLDVRVPASEKDTHLELAVSLQLTRSGLAGDRRVAQDGWDRFMALVDKTDWLK